jgi:hypothetical protein
MRLGLGDREQIRSAEITGGYRNHGAGLCFHPVVATARSTPGTIMNKTKTTLYKLLVVGPALCTGLSLAAQNGVSAPVYIYSQEGTGSSEWLGRHPDMREQIIEGEFRNQAFTIRELALRLDTRELNVAGRSWSQMTISMAATDITKVTSVFSTNAIGGLTTVFQGRVDWPGVTGFPVLYAPTIWGDLSGKLKYPFTTPWQHTGKQDFLTEFVFQGGHMANNANWGPSQYYEYHLDADAMTTDNHQAITALVPPTSSCVDPSNLASPTEGARLVFTGFVFSAAYANSQYANNLVASFASLYTAQNAPVIHAIGAGIVAGINLQADCNKLYVDLNKPWTAYFQTTTVKRGVALSPTTQVIMPWKPSLAGVEVWGQSAWTNSVNGNFSLSQAGRMIVPARQPVPTLPNRLATLAVSTSASVADIAPTTMFGILPAIFYRTK